MMKNTRLLFVIIGIVVISAIIVSGYFTYSRTESVGQELEAGDEIDGLRTQASKTFYVGEDSYQLLALGSPIHYENDVGNWVDINNTIAPSIAPWDYEMAQDVYTARFLSDFTAGQVVEWEYEGQTVAFQPMALEWTNDLDQIEQISMPQTVAGLVTNTPHLVGNVDTGYEAGSIRWNNAYGVGRHFWWTCDTGRLRKTLQLISAPPTPPQYILNGGNPVLRLNFIFDPSQDLDIYIDGVVWDQQTTVTTFNYTEFRYLDETLWYFLAARAWDSSGDNGIIVLSELRKVGNKLYVSVRVPYEWLENASYPVSIDPDLTAYSSTSDGYMMVAGAVYNTVWTETVGTVADDESSITFGQRFSVVYSIHRAFFFFDTSSITSGNTIDSATLNLYGSTDSSDTDFDMTIQDGQPTYPHDPLVIGDYNKAYYSGDGGSLSTSGFTTSGYNVITLSADGKSWINKTGDTKLCVKSSRDISGTVPSESERVVVYSSDQGGTSRDPYLYVVYSAAAAGYSFGTIIG